LQRLLKFLQLYKTITPKAIILLQVKSLHKKQKNLTQRRQGAKGSQRKPSKGHDDNSFILGRPLMLFLCAIFAALSRRVGMRFFGFGTSGLGSSFRNLISLLQKPSIQLSLSIDTITAR
jgi:hypothetical protein